MRIALACVLCVIAATAVAQPRGKNPTNSEIAVAVATQNTREAFRSRLNEKIGRAHV